MLTKLKCVTVAALVLGTTVFAQVQSARIVTIDLNRVFNEYYKTPIASQKLKDTAEQYNKEHEELMANYRKLTDELGKPIDDRKKRYEQKLAEGEDHRAVARKLAWKHHTDRRGGPGDFNRPLSHRDYPDIGIV